jgi:hypothetical protein
VTDDEDLPYLVPTHLREPQSIGPLPVRSFYVVLVAGLLFGAPVATVGRNELGDVGLWLGLVPIALATPFALTWLDPPAEHGFVKCLAHLARVLVRRTVLGVPQQPDLPRLKVADGAVWIPVGGRSEPRAVYRVPTRNLETASAVTRRGARAQWGTVVKALPHPIQIVVRGTPATTLAVLERVKAHGSEPARELSAWLGAHLYGGQLVERERYLVVPAEDLETLSDRCASLETSMRRIGLPLERVSTLHDALGAFLTPRPKKLGPAVVDVGASGHLVADGEYVRAFDLGRLPPTITTDWLAPLLNGDLPLDCSIDIQPLDLAWAKWQLDARRNALESSQATPGRAVALEQIAGLRIAYERRQTLPMRMSVSVVIRVPDRHTLERRTKRLRQRVKDLSAELRLLRWEQRAGWLAVVPLRRSPPPPARPPR